MNGWRKALLLAGIALVRAGPAFAQASDPWTATDIWHGRAMLYAWFPNFRSTANVPIPGGGTITIDTDPGSYLQNLEFAFMGGLEMRRGRWSIIADATFVRFGKDESNVASIQLPGRTLDLPVPASASADLDGFIATVASGYSLHESGAGHVDVVAGARYMRMKGDFGASLSVPVPGLPQSVEMHKTKDIWDGIVGLRGRVEFAERWFAPFHVDAGTGESRFTWQAFTGLGYHFGWGDAMIGYRHLAYDFKGGQPVSDATFSGPLAGVAFRF